MQLSENYMYLILDVKKIALSLHRNNGEVAQLVRAHDS